jgi:UDP-4-amino-4,6-dideoxy-N-acetyl-beta-L-altrosamine transaminase
MIPYGRHDITADDIAAVEAVMRSDFLTQGPAVPALEAAISEYCDVSHAVAVNSATSGLHIACLALGLAAGDLLWTVPITFVASANCGLYCGADIDFVDIDPATWNIDPAALESKLEIAQARGRLPKIIVAVHFTGRSADMRAIREMTRKYGVKLIEDASHAIGGDYLGARIGNCAYCDIAVFSLHPVKIITSGEGGLCMTKDAALAEAMRLYRSHGITRDVSRFQHDDAPWYYEQQALGFNYRLTDIQAALGLSQLRRINAYVDSRHELKRRYDDHLSGLPLQLPAPERNGRSALHLYVLKVDTKRAGVSRRLVFERMRQAGIGVNVHYVPVHLQPEYRKRGFAAGNFPVAEAYYNEAITIPLFPTLTIEDQDKVIAALKDALA